MSHARAHIPALFAAAALAFVTGVASAQDELELVDQGLSDVGPLGTSLRQVPLDLRLPSGFDRVYELPGRSISGERRFARFDGGVAALFARSDYLATANGPLALIPPGTVFVIGGSDDLLTGGAAARRASDLGRSRRLDLRAGGDVFGLGTRRPTFGRVLNGASNSTSNSAPNGAPNGSRNDAGALAPAAGMPVAERELPREALRTPALYPWGGERERARRIGSMVRALGDELDR
ncbi:MAG: hypothetical protein AAF356_03825 [Planctomycetota bacterium]